MRRTIGRGLALAGIATLALAVTAGGAAAGNGKGHAWGKLAAKECAQQKKELGQEDFKALYGKPAMPNCIGVVRAIPGRRQERRQGVEARGPEGQEFGKCVSAKVKEEVNEEARTRSTRRRPARPSARIRRPSGEHRGQDLRGVLRHEREPQERVRQVRLGQVQARPDYPTSGRAEYGRASRTSLSSDRASCAPVSKGSPVSVQGSQLDGVLLRLLLDRVDHVLHLDRGDAPVLVREGGGRGTGPAATPRIPSPRRMPRPPPGPGSSPGGWRSGPPSRWSARLRRQHDPKRAGTTRMASASRVRGPRSVQSCSMSIWPERGLLDANL